MREDAEIAIVSDLNKDGQFTTNEIIDNTSLSGSVDRVLISDLGTGTYYALVSPGSAFFPDGRSNTNYTLKLAPKAIAGVSPIKDPGFTYQTAFNIGVLSTAKTYKQFVGATDSGDFYQFSLSKNRTVTLSLSGMRDDAEIAIASDQNGDKQFTTNEIIDNTSLSGSGDRAVVTDLGKGTYYALVSPGSSFFPDGRANTNYTLKMSTGAPGSSTKKATPKKKSAPQKQSQLLEDRPISLVSPHRIGHSSLLQQPPQSTTPSTVQSANSQPKLISDASLLQALNPSCDVVMIGVALLTLGKHCLLR
jgi:hypothetical protein